METMSGYEEMAITVQRAAAGDDSSTQWEEGPDDKYLRVSVMLPWYVITPGESEVTLEPSTSTLQIPELKMISDAVHQATSDKDKFNKSQRVFHEDSAEHCLEFSDWMLEQFY
jgi:hypothetical protein